MHTSDGVGAGEGRLELVGESEYVLFEDFVPDSVFVWDTFCICAQ